MSPSQIPVAWTGLPATQRQGTWIYDFMDNDWSLPPEAAGGAVEDAPEGVEEDEGDKPPESDVTSSESEEEVVVRGKKKKRQPVRFFRPSLRSC